MKACWIALLWLLAASASEACTCLPNELQVPYRHSEAVFTGRVMRVQESGERGYNGVFATVLVLESWKGARVGQVVTIATGYGGGDCGVEFVPGSKYLVFAGLIARKGWLTTSICSHTMALGARSEEVDSLRAWKASGRVPPDPPRPSKSTR